MEISPDHRLDENSICFDCDHLFLGLAAAYAVKRDQGQCGKVQMICTGFSHSRWYAAYCGRLFPLIHIWCQAPSGQIFSGIFGTKNCIFLAGNGPGGSGDLISTDVSFRTGSFAAGNVNLLYAGRTLEE